MRSLKPHAVISSHGKTGTRRAAFPSIQSGYVRVGTKNSMVIFSLKVFRENIPVDSDLHY